MRLKKLEKVETISSKNPRKF